MPKRFRVHMTVTLDHGYFTEVEAEDRYEAQAKAIGTVDRGEWNKDDAVWDGQVGSIDVIDIVEMME